MINEKIRETWDSYMRPVGRSVGRGGISPDTITYLGVAVQAVVAWRIVDGALLQAGIVAIVAAAFDVLDGAVAKAQGRVRPFGALLDSTTDRISDALFLLPIAWLYGVSPDVAGRDRPWVAAVAMLALVLGFLVPYIKARAEGLGLVVKGGLAERLERSALIILGLLFAPLLPWLLVALVIMSAITVAQRMQQARAQGRSVAT